MMENNPRRRLRQVTQEDEHDYNTSRPTGPRPRSEAEDIQSWDKLPYQEELLVLLTHFDEDALTIRSEVGTSLFEGPYRNIATTIYSYIDQYQQAPKKHLAGLFVETLSKKADYKQEAKA